MSEASKKPSPRSKPPVKQVLVEEPVSRKPDVPGEKPETFRFRDFAQI